MASTSVFCTRALPTAERFGAWRESVGLIYDVAIGTSAPDRHFSARVESVMIGDIVLNRCRSNSQTFARPAARCASDGLDHYMIQLFLRGSVDMKRGSKSVRAGKSALVALDLADILDSCNTDFDLLNLFIPRQCLSGRLTEPDSMHGLTVDTENGGGRLLADYIVSLYKTGASLSGPDEMTASSVVIDLVAGAFNGASQISRHTPEKSDHALVLKARRIMSAKLTDRNLTPVQLAGQLNVSRARLYRAFRDYGGVNETLRDMRLQRCLADLSSASCRHLQVAEIAYRWGFQDPSHFARAFRNRYGVTASDARHAAGTQSFSPAAAGSLDRTYEAWISSIG